jgi:hypothetical protein
MPTAELLIIRQLVIVQQVIRVTALTVAGLFQQLVRNFKPNLAILSAIGPSRLSSLFS